MTTPDDSWVAVRDDVVTIRATGQAGRVRDVRFEDGETLVTVRYYAGGVRPVDEVFAKSKLKPGEQTVISGQGRLFH